MRDHHRVLWRFILILMSNIAFARLGSCAQIETTAPIRLYAIEEFDIHGKQVAMNAATQGILRVLEQQLAMRFEILHVPWKRAMENVLNDDGFLIGMSITPERAEKFAFSAPIDVNRNWLITRCDARFKFAKMSDLRGKTIGMVLGTSAGAEFDQLAQTQFKVESDTGAGIARINKLIRKRVDAIVWFGAAENVVQMEAAINHFYEPYRQMHREEDLRLCVLAKPVSIVTSHIASKINSKKIALLKRISEALVKARKEGKLRPLALPNTNP